MTNKKFSLRLKADIFVSVAITLIFFGLFIAIDFTELWFEITREYEDYELDELSGLALGGLIGLLFFNFRLLKYANADNQAIQHLSSKMEFQAYSDYLTELPNRRALEKHVNLLISESMLSGKDFTLMYIDLDSFKYVNDTLGHSIGDLLLKQVAQRLIDAKPEESMLARIGGDEFCLVIPRYLSNQLCFHYCETLNTRITQPFFIGEHKLHISQTAGISRFPEDGKTFEQLLQTADIAMYMGKNQGRDRHNFNNEDFTQDMQNRFMVLHGLEEAISSRQFFIVYQPKVHLQDSQVVGCEALIRWDHPQHGIIPPDEFIQIAEESNQIHKIDFFVLDSVCRQIKKWGVLACPVAINLSPTLFADENLAHKIINILNKYGVAPNMIELEITERTIISGSEIPFRVCQSLASAGISLSLDDFGTGYSSLSHVANFPINKIKIDRSFIDQICHSERTRNIVSAIIQLAKALDMKIIAEGIENEEQSNLLEHMGCDEAQGYFYAKPLALEDYSELLMT